MGVTEEVTNRSALLYGDGPLTNYSEAFTAIDQLQQSIYRYRALHSLTNYHLVVIWLQPIFPVHISIVNGLDEL